MMGQQKPLASLSSTLLARKGTARPAMRSQGFGGFGAMPGTGADAQDDLGWNDMGDIEPEGRQVVQAEASLPPVLLQREALAEDLTATVTPTADEASVPTADAASQAAPADTPRAISVATATRIGRETRARHAGHAKSAFTLRLDADRHLKLRLASALRNRSAQLLVTEALDAFLETLPEVETLLSQLPTRAAR